MRYILMFAGTMDENDMADKPAQAELVASYERVGRWFDEHTKSGKIVGGEELRGPSTATTVRFQNGKTIVTDGPFIEAKEVVGGFAIVDVKDLDEALALAKSWPGGIAVEVRPLVDRSAH